MFKPITAALVASAVLTTGVAFAQTPPNPTQRNVGDSEAVVPLFRITVVGRTTPAINYRPRRGDTKVDFRGTALMPQARGEAKVSGEQGYMNVEAKFDKFASASSFGPEYLTYVLWAVTPEGRATNLGEVQLDGDDAKVKVTTELQAFGLIVTAEPYFAVTQPSDVVVMENAIRPGTEGGVEVIQAKYELITRGSYLMNQDAARLNLRPLEPGAPLDLAQARNAVALARLAGADRFAQDTFDKAAGLLATAEDARENRRGGNAVMMAARQAAQTAEDARLVGLQRQEEAFLATQKQQALAREREALDRAQAEATRRQQAESAARAATAARGIAEFDARTAAAGQAAAELATSNADAARIQADAARRTAEAETLQARNTTARLEQDRTALRDQLREQLNDVLDTRETARGLIVNLSDVLFDSASATLGSGAREKLARVSGILVSHDGLELEVEGHTDSVGTGAYNQLLSERRADVVRAYLVDQRIASTSVGAVGFGEDRPVATNDTSAGRQQNRRVELIVSGEAIGRR
jgi:outer membrane protein OmpA-like peptidoglycan-associated protein